MNSQTILCTHILAIELGVHCQQRMACLIVFDHRRIGVPLIERYGEFEPTPKDEPTSEEHPKFLRILA